ncbi:MAG: GNAT family N-acetyltransferase [Bacilli bacterium]|nr:GNAT family N-acetyltransferase [Bacilli bacterium]
MIRLMKEQDKDEVIEMMTVFYASEAVSTNGSREIFESDFNNCINSCPYLEGYVFEENDNICGYAMVAKSFSTEFGKPCIWIEDLYIKEDYRHKKLGSLFFDFLKENYKDTIQRLEVDKNNVFAIKAYKKNNFEEVGYLQFVRKN